MAFEYGREEGFPTQYAPNDTAVTVDVLEAGFIAAFVILLISFYISLATTQTIFRYLRITLLLIIGLLLLLGNFGQEWEVSQIQTRTPYKAGSGAQINASIGLKIGLRSVNVTLKAPEIPAELKKEHIDYNERFEWAWDQGRFGFGPYSGHLQQQFRAAQYRGLPTPILWVMEYFVIDGEGFRFGRFYRTAGWYCHVMMYSALACWLLAIVLFRSVVVYGAYSLALCGFLQILSNVLWATIRNPKDLSIPFEDATLTMKFGTSFYLTLISGILSITIAIIIVILNIQLHTFLYFTMFGVDPLNSYNEIAYLTRSEQTQLRKKGTLTQDTELTEMVTEEDDDEYIPVYVRRKTGVFGPPVIRSNKPNHLLLSP